MSALDKEFEITIREALARYRDGEREHGPLDPAADSRDFILEAIEELEDCINYCAFQIIRLNRLRNANRA